MMLTPHCWRAGCRRSQKGIRMDRNTEAVAAWLQHLTNVVMHLASSAQAEGLLHEQDAKGIADQFEALANRLDGTTPDDRISDYAATLHALAQCLRR